MLKRKTQPVGWDKAECARKLHVANLFKEEIVSEFLDQTEYDLFNRWRVLPASETQARDELFLQAQALTAFRKFIDDTIVVGQMAQSELNTKYQKEIATNR